MNVVERGEYKDRLYIVMELLEGKSLAEMLSEGKLDLSVSIKIMIQTTAALVRIHEKNIIHRDLKPENIMIIRTKDNPYFVKLLDFGLAKIQSLTSMTQSGTIMGTVFYLAPEQITFEKITTATDIYALGVTFYQILSGEKPFLADSIMEITQLILEKEPLEPKKLRPDVPEELNNLVNQMMNKNHLERPSSEQVLKVLKNQDI